LIDSRQPKTRTISGPFYTIVEYISPAKMLHFYDIVCNYMGRPHVTAATRPCT